MLMDVLLTPDVSIEHNGDWMYDQRICTIDRYNWIYTYTSFLC